MNSIEPCILVLISGPTASGKSKLAAELASYYKTEIISADSRQFYKELSIGVAIPDTSILQMAKHHFIHTHTIFKPLNAFGFSVLADQLLDKLFQKYYIVIVTGGSGLYLKSLYFQIDTFPDPPAALREQLDVMRENNFSEMLELLKKYDPEFYATGEIQNPMRVQRALEVSIVAQKPYSSMKTGIVKQKPYHILKLAIHLSDDELKRNIILRVQEMRKQGLTEEARQLYNYRHLPVLHTIGYRELFDYFDGKYQSEDQAYEKIIVHTWRYARKQMRWLRKEQFTFLQGNEFDTFKQHIDNFIKNLEHK